MTDDQMGYHGLVEDAMRGVVRRVLEKTAAEGLPGQHHFYISFRTTAPGVKISEQLLSQYPEEMTIVIQHQFAGFEVDKKGFRISLSFSGVLEALSIPFAAIVGFVDPAVSFGLQFGGGPKAAHDAAPAEAAETQDTATPDSGASGTGGADEARGATGGDVVRLDNFRKK